MQTASNIIAVRTNTFAYLIRHSARAVGLLFRKRRVYPFMVGVESRQDRSPILLRRCRRWVKRGSIVRHARCSDPRTPAAAVPMTSGGHHHHHNSPSQGYGSRDPRLPSGKVVSKEESRPDVVTCAGDRRVVGPLSLSQKEACVPCLQHVMSVANRPHDLQSYRRFG